MRRAHTQPNRVQKRAAPENDSSDPLRLVPVSDMSILVFYPGIFSFNVYNRTFDCYVNYVHLDFFL